FDDLVHLMKTLGMYWLVFNEKPDFSP
ncbi:MAG: response regulator, partial [Calditrichaeota bacterium]